MGVGGRRGRGRGLRPVPARGRRLRGRAQGAERLVVVAGAANDDPIRFHGDLHGPVPGPVLSVDRVLLDGGVEPQPVSLLAMVEGAFQRSATARRARPGRWADAARRSAAAAATTAPAGTGGAGVLLGLLLG